MCSKEVANSILHSLYNQSTEGGRREGGESGDGCVEEHGEFGGGGGGIPGDAAAG